MGRTVCLRCKGKTLLGIVNKLFGWQHPAMFCLYTFPAHNLNFYWTWRWWDQIQAIFLNLFYFISDKTTRILNGNKLHFWLHFPPKIWIFNWRWRWWDRIKAIFLNLFYFKHENSRSENFKSNFYCLPFFQKMNEIFYLILP